MTQEPKEEPLVYCSSGTRGRFKASGIKFKIIKTTQETSTIRLEPFGTEQEVKDSDLKQAAVKIIE